MNKILADKGYFHIAYSASLLSVQTPKVGAVIVKKKPVSVGCNSAKIHPQFTRFGRFPYVAYDIHAETQAIISVRKLVDLRGATMYVYREYFDGRPALSKPCESCYDSLLYFGFKDVFYTTDTYPFYERMKIK